MQKPKGLITFVANDDTRGDGVNAETMDCIWGGQYPWLSLAVPKLREMGYDVEVLSWKDQSIDWKSKELVVMGPVWGYSKEQEQFNQWLHRMTAEQVRLKNCPEFVEQNFMKTYLQDIENVGVPIPYTRIVTLDSTQSLADIQAEFKRTYGIDDLVIKGVVDAAAFGYKHIKPNEVAENEAHFEQLKKENEGVVIQPFLPEVSKKGEMSFVFFNGTLSHSFVKVPAAKEERVQVFYGGKSFHINDNDIESSIQKIRDEFRPDLDLSAAEITSAKEQATSIHNKISTMLALKNVEPPLYTRVDGVMVNGELQVMEIEGIEPYMEMKEAMQNNPQNDVVGNYAAAIADAHTEAMNTASMDTTARYFHQLATLQHQGRIVPNVAPAVVNSGWDFHSF